MKFPNIYKVRKYKTTEYQTKWVEVQKTEIIIRPWVKFLRWLFSDQWIKEKNNYDEWYDIRINNVINRLEKRARYEKELCMHRKFIELGYEVKCQFNATVYSGTTDPEEFINNSELIDHAKPLFEIVKKNA